MVGFYGGAPLEYAGLNEQGADAVPATTGQVLGSSFGEGMAANLFPRMLRSIGRSGADTGLLGVGELGTEIRMEPEQPIDPETANAQYGIKGQLSFGKPVAPSVAQDLHDHKQAQIEREDAIARRESGLLTGGAARFTASVAAGLLDPVNIAAGVIPVAGEARVASLLGRGAIETMGAAERAGMRAAAGAASGSAQMTALQPLEFGLSRQEHEDYTAGDALRSIAIGGLLGGGLHVVGGAVADRAAGRYANPLTQRLEEAGPDTREALLQGAIAQHIEDRPVNVAPALDLADAGRGVLPGVGLIGKPVQAMPPHRVVTADGNAVDVAPVIVEAGDLKTSADAGYDVSLQPRDRGRAASQQQVREMAAGLDPARLGMSAEADRGAPIVGDDGMVESGNGRVMSIRSAYAQDGDAAARYREWLTSQGVDVSQYNEPVLVRQRTTPLNPSERRAFAIAANRPATLAMSAPERALADARSITPDMLELIRNPDDLGALANRDFVRSFVEKLPQAEQGMIATGEGGLSAEGLGRVRNAVLARAYGDGGNGTAILARIAEATQDDIKSISNSLVSASPLWARMRADIEAGRVRADVDMTAELLEAVRRTADLRSKGVRLSDHLAQQDAFDRLSPAVENWMRMFYDPAGRRAAGAARIIEALKTYATEARKVSAERGLDLGLAPVTPAELQRLAAQRGRGEQPGLPIGGGVSDGANNAANRIEVRGSRPDAPGGLFGDQGTDSAGPGQVGNRAAELADTQARAVRELTASPVKINETALAAEEAARAKPETLADIEKQNAEIEARIMPPEPSTVAAGEQSAGAGRVAPQGETAPQAGTERAAIAKPPEIVAADAEIEVANARAAAYERAANCIVRGG